jgi:hypothetical protein
MQQMLLKKYQQNYRASVPKRGTGVKKNRLILELAYFLQKPYFNFPLYNEGVL